MGYAGAVSARRAFGGPQIDDRDMVPILLSWSATLVTKDDTDFRTHGFPMSDIYLIADPYPGNQVSSARDVVNYLIQYYGF
jgi:hypothetical protein